MLRAHVILRRIKIRSHTILPYHEMCQYHLEIVLLSVDYLCHYPRSDVSNTLSLSLLWQRYFSMRLLRIK
jgi:hypothetical protein